MTYDAIVIGAGVNGLVTAGYLARRGLSVLVLERRAIVGGSAVTEEFAPGFRTDTAQHDVGWISPRIVRDLDLANHGLQLLSSGRPLLAPTGDGEVLHLHSLPALTARSLHRFSPSDAAKWPAFAERIAKLAGFLQGVYAAAPPSPDASSIAELLGLLNTGLCLRRLGKPAMVDLLRSLPMSAAELLDDEFESDVLKGALGAQAIRHLCQGPRAAGTVFTMLHHQVGGAAGAFHTTIAPLGGVGTLANALADSAKAAGAQIRTNADVARITIRDGVAVGVVLHSGEEISAARVISAADPRRTFLQLCEPSQFAPEFVRAVRNIRFRGVWAKVNLALDALPTLAGAAAEEMGRLGAVTISPSLSYLERGYDDAKYGRVSAAPYLDVRVPSLVNPSMAPAGKHVMSIHVQYTPYHLREGAWDAGASRALGDRVVATLESYLPGLQSAVRHRQVISPADLESQFSLTEGHAYHGELTLDQILFMRPVPEYSRYCSPVPGLFLCGPGTHPGGGIAGAAGANAAREILRDAKGGRSAATARARTA